GDAQIEGGSSAPSLDNGGPIPDEYSPGVEVPGLNGPYMESGGPTGGMLTLAAGPPPASWPAPPQWDAPVTQLPELTVTAHVSGITDEQTAAYFYWLNKAAQYHRGPGVGPLHVPAVAGTNFAGNGVND